MFGVMPKKSGRRLWRRSRNRTRARRLHRRAVNSASRHPGDEVERIIRETCPDADCALVLNPEFLREGGATQDFKHPDRIVIGTNDTRAREVMSELYRPLYRTRSASLPRS